MTECFRCGSTEDLEQFGNGLICPDCRPDSDNAREDLPATETEPDVFPENLVDRRMWMPWQRVDGRKIPSAIYADTDEPMSYPNLYNWRDFE
jgi:hypothetical protein